MVWAAVSGACRPARAWSPSAARGRASADRSDVRPLGRASVPARRCPRQNPGNLHIA